jgi:FlaA1/EpsC-like NDP-sugar epimerase
MPARVGLFGASTAGVQCLETLRDDPRLRIHCFFDNDPARWGSAVAGLRVRKPTPAAFAEVDFIVVSSMHVDAIVQQVIDAGYGRKLVLDASALAARVEHALAGATR